MSIQTQRTTRSVSDRASGNALGVGSMVLWAAGFPAAEILLVSWPPLALITVRFALAVAFLIPLWILMDGWRAVRSPRWGLGLGIGAVTFGVGAYFLLLAQYYTDPVTVALIASATPIASTLIEMWQGQRKLTTVFALGLLTSVLGGIVATTSGAPSELGLGAVLAIISCFVFSWGSVAAVRYFPNESPIGRAAITMSGGAVATMAILLTLVAIGRDDYIPPMPQGPELMYLIVYAFAGMALSQAMWLASVGRLGVALASMHINLAPFYVMVLMLATGSQWDWVKAAGAAIVAIGVIAAQRR